MTAPELKPCPFCGGTDTIILNGPVEDDWCAVSCDECHARGPINYTDRHAIAAWNTRTDLSQAAIAAKNAQIIDLIEALRKRSNGEICGCGVDNPTDVCLSHYDVIEAVVRNRVPALSRDLEQARQDIADLRQAVRYANDHADQAKSERDAAIARAEKAEADRDEWRKTAIAKIEGKTE